MENASSLGPVTVEVAGIEESISLFEEEVVSDQLLLLSIGHGAKRVESSGEFTCKSVAGLNDFGFNLISLFPRDCWAERELSQVTADSDAG